MAISNLVFFIGCAIFVLLCLIAVKIAKKISANNKKRHEQKIFEEKQRKISCSSQLILVAGNNDKNAVMTLLEQGADINYQDSDGKTPLSNAIINGNADIASLLLEKGADIDVLYEEKPLVFCAIENDNKELVELLIEKGANIECEHEKEYTPLFYATCNNKIDIVSLLLEKGANIEYKGKYESTPLFVATCNGNLALVSLLLEKGANIECENEDRLTPLSAAAANGHIDIVSFLLEKGANIEHEGRNGMTPLGCAVFEKNKEIISLLLEKGADINHGGKPLLFSAIRSKDKEMVSLLLEKGVDVYCTSETYLDSERIYGSNSMVNILGKKMKETATPLLEALNGDNYTPEIVSLLIENGVDVNREIWNGYTPLRFAIVQNNKDAVALLLNKGADPNNGNVLSFVVKSNFVNNKTVYSLPDEDIASLLIDNGANPSDLLFFVDVKIAQFALSKGADANYERFDKTYRNFFVPLSWAIHTIQPSSFIWTDYAQLQKEMVLFLISHGANVNHEISSQSEKNAARTPLEAAIVTGNTEMASLLITYGADVNYKTQNGNTPLLFAALHQKTELVPILKAAGAVASVSSKDG